MGQPTVTLTLSQEVYDELQQRARRRQHRVEDEAALALAATLGAEQRLPADLEAAIGVLALLDDEALWRVSRSQPMVEDGVLLDALVDRHDRVMVLRAEAVARLRERGHDVSALVARA